MSLKSHIPLTGICLHHSHFYMLWSWRGHMAPVLSLFTGERLDQHWGVRVLELFWWAHSFITRPHDLSWGARFYPEPEAVLTLVSFCELPDLTSWEDAALWVRISMTSSCLLDRKAAILDRLWSHWPSCLPAHGLRWRVETCYASRKQEEDV